MTSLKCRIGIHDWKITEIEKYKHKKVCTNCGKVEFERHNYRDGEMIFKMIDQHNHIRKHKCSVCGYVSEGKIEPHWMRWKENLDPCWKIYKCAWCEYEEERVRKRHSYPSEDQPTTEIYLREGSCELGIYCRRCGYISPYINPQYEHQWSAPHYAGPYTCERVRECRRCGKVEIVDVSHIFDHTEREGDKIIKICSRCGERKVVK